MWTRRFLLKSGAMTLASLGLGPGFLTRLAAEVPEPGRRSPVLVTIFLRGAMDGLMAVPPFEDPYLPQFRPSLSMGAARSDPNAVHDLDGRFGLHPAMTSLLPLWQTGQLGIIHGVGSPNPTRSHFEAQELVEAGTPYRRGTPSGWLNRTLAQSGASSTPFRAVALTPDLPRSLYGEVPSLAIRDLADFELRLPFSPDDAERVGSTLQQLYGERDAGAWRRPGERMFDSLRVLASKDVIAYREARSSKYPATNLGRSLLQIAFLIQAGVGLQVAYAESAGWDTHASQGTVGGTFAYHARDLADSLAAFWEDIEPYQDDVVVLTLTEFGRTVHENGSGGTDHGYGSCVFALGNRVDGGKVYGDVPSLSPEALFEGRDLPVTTDYRAVLADAAFKLFDIRDSRRLFPGWPGYRLPFLW